MKKQGPDPAVYVFGGLLMLALLSVYGVFAGRSCAKSMLEAANAPADQPYTSSREFAKAAVKLPRADYNSVAESAASLDFGIGVRLGLGRAELKALLGDADSSARAAGGRQVLSYMFPPSAKGPQPDERRRGGVLAALRMAVLAVTLREGIAEEILFSISPVSKKGDQWEFIRLGGKPLADCSAGDFIALLGEPSHKQAAILAWHYAPEDAALGDKTSIYLHALFDRPEGRFSELYIVKNGD